MDAGFSRFCFLDVLAGANAYLLCMFVLIILVLVLSFDA